MTPTGVFAISKPIDGQGATHANGGTVGFAAKTTRKPMPGTRPAVANGGKTCEGPAGVREGGMGKMYLAYLRDPDATRSARCIGCTGGGGAAQAAPRCMTRTGFSGSVSRSWPIGEERGSAALG